MTWEELAGRQMSCVDVLTKYSNNSKLCRHALDLAYLQSTDAVSLMEEVAQWYEVGGKCSDNQAKYEAGVVLWNRIDELLNKEVTMDTTRYETVAKVSGVATRKAARGTKVAAVATGRGLRRFGKGLRKASRAFVDGVKEG